MNNDYIELPKHIPDQPKHMTITGRFRTERNEYPRNLFYALGIKEPEIINVNGLNEVLSSDTLPLIPDRKFLDLRFKRCTNITKSRDIMDIDKDEVEAIFARTRELLMTEDAKLKYSAVSMTEHIETIEKISEYRELLKNAKAH